MRSGAVARAPVAIETKSSGGPSPAWRDTDVGRVVVGTRRLRNIYSPCPLVRACIGPRGRGEGDPYAPVPAKLCARIQTKIKPRRGKWGSRNKDGRRKMEINKRGENIGRNLLQVGAPQGFPFFFSFSIFFRNALIHFICVAGSVFRASGYT